MISTKVAGLLAGLLLSTSVQLYDSMENKVIYIKADQVKINLIK